ncbi:MAG: hypothetical protein KH419_00910 [Clostridioides difficile]|nr:hypothetical protein [Clostridioides difficile]
MDNFLFNVLASLTASVVVYLISKLFKKAKRNKTVVYKKMQSKIFYKQ